MDDQHDADDAPEFGPQGYLPERASRRARKIVLRAPMGIQWVVGSLVVGVVVVVAGWLALRDTTPGPPYELVPAELVTPTRGGVQLWEPTGTDESAIVVTVGNRTRVFAWEGGDLPAVCLESGLVEGNDGRVWRPTGRGLDGTESLAEHPLVVTDGGVLHADPTTTITPLPSDPEPVERGCG